MSVDLQRMWLPKLLDAVATGGIDVALSCGPLPEPAGIATEVFCAEPLVVGLRPGHRLAGRDTIALSELAHEVLGAAPEALFPAWALTQRQALAAAGIAREDVSRFGGQAGTQAPTLRPHHRKTAQAGPEALSTSSLPILQRFAYGSLKSKAG